MRVCAVVIHGNRAMIILKLKDVYGVQILSRDGKESWEEVTWGFRSAEDAYAYAVEFEHSYALRPIREFADFK